MSTQPPRGVVGERSRLRGRLADPRLISLPTFVISSALLSFEIWSYGLTVFVLSQVFVFALLALARTTYLGRRYCKRHAWVMLMTIAASSLIGSIGTQMLLAESDAAVGADGAFTRMIVIPAAGLLTVALIDYRDKVRELRAATEQLRSTRDSGLESLAQAREDIVQRVQASLTGAMDDLQGGDATVVAGELAEIAQETVRPLSHELAASTPDFSPALAAPTRVKWSTVMSEVASRPLIIPWLMALAVAVISIRFTFVQSDVAVGATLSTIGPVTVSMDGSAVMASIAFLAVIFVTVWALSIAAVRITRPILLRVSGARRWLVVAISVIGIGVGLQLILLVLPILPGSVSSIGTDPIGRFLAFTPVVIIALVLAIARSVSYARVYVIKELTRTKEELTWEVARIRLELWMQQRQFAQEIHGPLQATITASALLLTTSDSDRSAGIAAARARIASALDRLHDPRDVAADIDSGLADIQHTWAGVCDVDLQVSPSAHGALARDTTSRQATLLIVGEAVANAAMHGRASHIDVALDLDDGRFLRLTVTDNGSGIADSSTRGLGSTILDDACGDWELTNTDDGARLRALVAFADTSSPEVELLCET